MKPFLSKPSAAAVLLLAFATLNSRFSAAHAFEGRITAVLARGGEVETLFYTVGSNQLRLERGETNRPHAKNIVDLNTGAITLLFPHNRSFLRLSNQAGGAPSPRGSQAAGALPMPPQGLPPRLGPQNSPLSTPAVASAVSVPAGRGPGNLPDMAMPPMPQMPQMPPDFGGGAGVGPQPGAVGGMPAMPVMPMMPMPQAELKATDQTTNLLGYLCTRYELKQRGEIMEIWATDQLLPFQPYLANQPHRFGPRGIEEEWPQLLQAKKLFPVLVVLKSENGPERLRFELKTIKPEQIADPDGSLFEPPSGYREIRPLSF
jgi:hypothetical protein